MGIVSKNTNLGAFGVVCRNNEGSYLGASARVFEGVADPATLEALAYRKALILARDLMQTQVGCQFGLQ